MSETNILPEKKVARVRDKRMCTALVNNSNYKKLRFFPYKESFKFFTKDTKTKGMIEKWVSVKKHNKDLEAPIVCEMDNGKKININIPFPRKLKDVFLPRRPNRQSLEHQKVLQKKFKENLPQSYLLYWEMGSGKTLGILSALFYLEKIPPKITIVCSISMIDYWMNNLLDFHTKNETVDVEIMGYSYFENKFLEEEDREEEDMLKELSKRVFIVDEAHHYRNMSVNMQRALQKYSYADKLYLLTGTPLVNSADELKMWATFFKIIDNNKLPNLDSSSSEYIKWIENNLQNKVMYFNPVMNKNMQDAGSYPDVEEKTISIPMTWMQTLVYFLSEGTASFLGTQIISAKKNNGLSLHKQVANGFKDTKGKFISPKNEFILKANSNEEEYPFPHVIFSGNLETGVEDIFDKLKKQDKTISIITGNTDALKRQEIVDEYNQGKIKNLLISRVGNEGINLLGTGTLFITTRHENEESANQTKARVVRYESHANCELKKVKIIDLLSIFPTSPPTDAEKAELGVYMSSYLKEKISGSQVYDELKSKIRTKKETVEEHLNKLNKEKESNLSPVLESIKEIGKDWWEKNNKVVEKNIDKIEEDIQKLKINEKNEIESVTKMIGSLKINIDRKRSIKKEPKHKKENKKKFSPKKGAISVR